MNQVEETKLAALRIMKAMTLVKQLRESYRELQTRFNMVENHNLELQDLINRVSADQSAVEEAIESALEGLESLGELESFGTLDLNELEDAEAFTLDGSSEEDLDTFEEMYKIDVGINLHRLEPDNHGNLYVSSRGDYYNIPSKTFIIDTRTDKVTDTLHLLPNSNMTLSGDSLWLYSTEFSYSTNQWTVSYAILDTRTKTVVTRNFIKDGTDENIKVPYGIAVNKEAGEFFVTDAKDYVSPGTLHCFSIDEGKRKWSVTTGDIPAHIVFTYKKLKPVEHFEEK